MDEFDLVCIIRGGGSQIDLDCFDHYELASHVAQFPKPILTGIGHERDETITDLVAHTKLKTPTAVAEFLINGMRSFDEQLDQLMSILHQLTTQHINRQRESILQLNHRLKTGFREQLKYKRQELNHQAEKIRTHTKNLIRSYKLQLENTQKHLELINPVAVLKRGYSITLHNGKRLNGQKLNEGDELKTVTLKRVIKSKVQKITENE